MKLPVRNEQVFSGLPVLQSTGYKYCYLITEDNEDSKEVAKNESTEKKQQTGANFFEFLYNPEAITENYSVNYSETQIPYRDISPVNFLSGGNSTWSIDNLILDGFDQKKSIQPLLDKLKSLRVPITSSSIKAAPKRVYLKWGGFKFGLCVLTSVNTQITRWIDGTPVTARVSLVFKEVPKSLDNKNTEIIKKLEKAEKERLPIKQVLTDKQVLDATKTVQDYLKAKKSFLPTRIQQVLNSSRYTLKVNKESGQVDLLDGGEKFVEMLGTYNGDRFNPK
jgi:hypothetical protein